MSSQSHEKAKRNSFLVFVLGCVLAVSGAARLDEGERMIRIRQAAQGATKGKVRAVVKKSLAPLLPKLAARYHKAQTTSVKQKATARKAIEGFLQAQYAALIKSAAVTLKIRQKTAQVGALKPALRTILALGWLKGGAKKKAAKKAKPLPPLNRALVTAMASRLMGNKKKKAVPRLPKALRDTLAQLTTQAVAHLTPYVMWEALLSETIGTLKARMTRDPATERAMLKSLYGKKAELSALMDVLKKLEAKLEAKDKGRFFLHPALEKQLLAHLQTDQATDANVAALHTMLVHHLAVGHAPEIASHLAQRLLFSLKDWKLICSRKLWQPKCHLKGFLIKQSGAMKAVKPTFLAPAPKVPKVRKAPKAPVARKAPASQPASRATSQPVAAKRPAPRPQARPVAVKKGASASMAALLMKQPSWPAWQPAQVRFVKVTKRISKWPASLPVFLLGAFFALFGIVLWRRTIAIEVKEKLKNQKEDSSNPFTLLRNMQGPLQSLMEDIDELDEATTCERIDHILEGFVLPFAEVREGVIQQLGMADGAEILVTVAFGERMLNRVWSAASDGHMPEARAVYPDALDAMTEAYMLAQNALEKESA